MFKQLLKRRGVAVAEYTIMLVLIIGAFFLFKGYITKAISGRWKTAGDIFGQGRRYAPGLTDICAYDYIYHNIWYNLECFEDNCDCFSAAPNDAVCKDCIRRCRTPRCDQ